MFIPRTVSVFFSGLLAMWSADLLKRPFAPFVLTSVLAALVFSSSSHALSRGDVLSGKVVRVADGDTVTLLAGGNKQHRVRLAEIDAPESGQAFGRKSRDSLNRMCAGQSASVHVQDIDRYGRVVGRVVCSGVDTSVEQVRLGMAWVYDSYVRDRSLYKFQSSAREKRIGLWSDSSPVKPWEWRRGVRGPGDTGAAVQGNRNSRIYHVPGCPGYGSMSPKNVVDFSSEAEAAAAGYRKAGNCR